MLHCGARYLLFVEVREMTVISVHVLTLHALDAFGYLRLLNDFVLSRIGYPARIRDVFGTLGPGSMSRLRS